MEEIFFLIFIFIFIFNNKKKYIILFSIALIIITNYKLDISFYKIVFFLLGIIIAPMVTNLTYLLTYKKILPLNKKYFKKVYIKLDIIIDVLFEEIIWREIFIRYIINKFKNVYLELIIICFLSFLFVIAHKIRSKFQFTEMFLYTLLLSFSSLLLNGINFGLHLGRNNYVSFLESVWKDYE
ncbi:hypothetical protein GCM10023142_36810 [Anaerocolumna aminovalerica]|uniref:CAAX prenyl protease 2/Lysostaphin resistance protein A-like domain-containing protein n=1 Tax=Anaerocolumna aminovalerica TaxID=1527 RepID=A0A1I5CUL6_9FIRM|nr:CPBP family glutamic-type intramembrane protease [Anaerocolumna aminovalerica]SFN90331.1 hypothetical protein SAMN04489757_1044 [Anaerocolumna aminovalerica]